MKTAELEELALDWAVAKCEGTLGAKPSRCFDCKYFEERSGRDDAIYYCHHPKSEWGGSDDDTPFGDGVSPDHGVHRLCPITVLTPEPYSTNWAQGGPIIDAQKMNLIYDREWIYDPTQVDPEDEPDNGDRWLAEFDDGFTTKTCYGPTALVAAMRCFVMSALGDEIDVPEELK